MTRGGTRVTRGDMKELHVEASCTLSCLQAGCTDARWLVGALQQLEQQEMRRAEREAAKNEMLKRMLC